MFKLTISRLRLLLLSLPYYIAVGFGIGFLQYMPGTFGTLLMGVPSYILISYLTIRYYIIIVFLGILLGIRICSLAERVLHEADAPAIIWDEVCGYWLTMLGAPTGITWIVVGFFAFRFFDIVKPWPINLIQQKVHGGLGIMLDDIMAAIYASCIIHACAYIVSQE